MLKRLIEYAILLPDNKEHCTFFLLDLEMYPQSGRWLKKNYEKPNIEEKKQPHEQIYNILQYCSYIVRLMTKAQKNLAINMCLW